MLLQFWNDLFNNIVNEDLAEILKNKQPIKVTHFFLFSLTHLSNSHDIWIKLLFSCMHVRVSTIWVICITTTYQCTFPLCVSGIPVIRGQYTDCNLDMTENALKGGRRGAEQAKTMESSELRKESLVKCPLLQTWVQHASNVYLHLHLKRQNRGREGCLPTF